MLHIYVCIYIYTCNDVCVRVQPRSKHHRSVEGERCYLHKKDMENSRTSVDLKPNCRQRNAAVMRYKSHLVVRFTWHGFKLRCLLFRNRENEWSCSLQQCNKWHGVKTLAPGWSVMVNLQVTWPIPTLAFDHFVHKYRWRSLGPFWSNLLQEVQRSCPWKARCNIGFLDAMVQLS